MDKKFGIKHVVAIGIGTALFIVLTNVQIPLGFIPNTAMQTRAALLAFFSAVFGPVVGGAIGLIGHALGDAVFYGSVWWSWVFPDAVFGIIVGLFAAKYRVKEGGFGKKEIILFNVVQVIANAVAWIVVAPVLDILIYAEPAKRYLHRALELQSQTLSSSVFWVLCCWRLMRRSAQNPEAFQKRTDK